MDEKKSIALEAVSREVVNMENIPIEGVFENLKCTREGLRSNEVKERLQLFGYNKLEEKKDISGNYTMRSFYHEVVKLQNFNIASPENGLLASKT
ncbi:hypothetical protein Syun_019050 [Stephania yunnanensis]|uniref:Cation-transporting P-type ATPase N-terminal domain-containing protein n=1 Tax=Stephania yunnanensis TaxID=152371 RepID=A0AAP0NWC2_9MAGN